MTLFHAASHSLKTKQQLIQQPALLFSFTLERNAQIQSSFPPHTCCSCFCILFIIFLLCENAFRDTCCIFKSMIGMQVIVDFFSGY